ncbi:hypothetical protein PJL18_04049 [Paenarthrobacter nicotinovorans]|nr:hypothetical protein [Paenarthrobacter nicotinovorans]
MSESLVLTALPKALASWVNAMPHIRRKAMLQPMNRLVPMAPSRITKYRRRLKTWTRDAR